MTVYTERIQSIIALKKQQDDMIESIKRLVVEYNNGAKSLNELINASRILVTVTDLNTHRVNSFIEGVINKALLEMYPTGEYYIEVKKQISRSSTVINVHLFDSNSPNDESLDLDEQAGDGVARIISFLFSLSLIELTGGRKFVSLDEVLTGFHEDSLKIIANIIQIFKKGGFQFIACEYDINNLGVIYQGVKVGNHINMEELGLASEVSYVRSTI